MSRSNLQALKLSEIINSVTEFDLYIDLGGKIVPYTQGPHSWSQVETEQLQQSGQFVLLYNRADAVQVQSYLARRGSVIDSVPIKNVEAVIGDGISEFLKTLYAVRLSEDNYGLIKSLLLSVAKFLNAYPHLSEICLQLACHDSYSFYHSARVAAYGVALGLQLEGPDIGRLWDIAMGAFLHDIGNLSVSPEILNRVGSLSESEWLIIRQHPDEALRMLENVPLTKAVRDIIFFHHERLDGGGYPRRLRGSMLPFEVRVVSFADVYAALTIPRSYQKARSARDAALFMEEHLLKFLDPKVLVALRQIVVIEPDEQNQAAV